MMRSRLLLLLGLGLLMGVSSGCGDAKKGPAELVSVRPTRVHASSTMKSSKDSQGNLNNYQSSMAIDGRTDTWWCEDEKGEGVDVRFTMDLPGWEVHGIRLVPGYDKVRQDRWGDRWYINNRIAQIEIQTFDLEGRTVDRQMEWLEDRRLWHEVKLRTPATLSSIELRIVSVHPSTIAQGRRTRWKDSGIAEIELLVPKGSQ